MIHCFGRLGQTSCLFLVASAAGYAQTWSNWTDAGHGTDVSWSRVNDCVTWRIRNNNVGRITGTLIVQVRQKNGILAWCSEGEGIIPGSIGPGSFWGGWSSFLVRGDAVTMVKWISLRVGGKTVVETEQERITRLANERRIREQKELEEARRQAEQKRLEDDKRAKEEAGRRKQLDEASRKARELAAKQAEERKVAEDERRRAQEEFRAKQAERTEKRRQAILADASRRIEQNNAWIRTFQSRLSADSQLSNDLKEAQDRYYTKVREVAVTYGGQFGSPKTQALRAICYFLAKKAAETALSEAKLSAELSHQTRTADSSNKGFAALAELLGNSGARSRSKASTERLEKYQKLLDASILADAEKGMVEADELFDSLGFVEDPALNAQGSTKELAGRWDFKGFSTRTTITTKVSSENNSQRLEDMKMDCQVRRLNVEWSMPDVTQAEFSKLLPSGEYDVPYTAKSVLDQLVTGRGRLLDYESESAKPGPIFTQKDDPSDDFVSYEHIFKGTRGSSSDPLANRCAFGDALRTLRLAPRTKGSSLQAKTSNAFFDIFEGGMEPELTVENRGIGRLTRVVGCNEPVMLLSFSLKPTATFEYAQVGFQRLLESGVTGEAVVGLHTGITYFERNDTLKGTRSSFAITELKPSEQPPRSPSDQQAREWVDWYFDTFGSEKALANKDWLRMSESALALISKESPRAGLDWAKRVGLFDAKDINESTRQLLMYVAADAGERELALDLAEQLTNANPSVWYRFGNAMDSGRRFDVEESLLRELMTTRVNRFPVSVLATIELSKGVPDELKPWKRIVEGKLFQTNPQAALLMATYGADDRWRAQNALLAFPELIALCKSAEPGSTLRYKALLAFEVSLRLGDPAKLGEISAATLLEGLSNVAPLYVGNSPACKLEKPYQPALNLLTLLAKAPEVDAKAFLAALNAPTLVGILTEEQKYTVIAEFASRHDVGEALASMRPPKGAHLALATQQKLFKALADSGGELEDLDSLFLAARQSGDRPAAENALLLALSGGPITVTRRAAAYDFFKAEQDPTKRCSLLRLIVDENSPATMYLDLAEAYLGAGRLEQARIAYAKAVSKGQVSPTLAAKLALPKSPVNKSKGSKTGMPKSGSSKKKGGS